MIQDLKAYLATHLPEATVEANIHQEDSNSDLFGPKGGAVYTVMLAVEIEYPPLALGAFRRAGHGRPTIPSHVYTSVAVANDASRVMAARHRLQGHALSRRQWAEADEGLYSQIVEDLTQAKAKTEARVAEYLEKWAAHPINVMAIRQMQKQARIEANQPTADVDAYIIANMGYTAETLAALGKATRRDRRREARQRMTAEARRG